MITSIQNEQVKSWKKLQRKKYRTETETFLIEGYHLIEEAFKSGWEFSKVIVEEGANVPSWFGEATVTLVSKQVFKEISQTEAPQGIAAIVKMKTVKQGHDKHILLVDAVQDPGNLGTIIRTADAAGFSKVILGTGTVDLYNDKVIRATQGSIFHLPIEQDDLRQAIPTLKQSGYSVWASTLESATYYKNVKADEKTALIIGNEGAGINEKLITLADKLVKIPIYGEAESLNVSVAAGILMYHMKNN